MTSTRWKRVKAIFDAACDMPADERAAFIASAANGDPDLIAEVESLVASLESAGSFIEALEIPAGAGDYEIGANIGPYRIVQTIGAGGMGTVYQAVRVDDLYRKLVALKVVRKGLFDGVARRRFDTERQILAHLDHPNIAKLLDGGTTPDGQPYFVMDFIGGAPIDRYCDDERLSVRDRLRLFLTVCSAVQYAHENFVVHRDIKPANILVTADGQVRLLDFGIAKLLDPETLISEETTTFVQMLTPEFASPEQLRNMPATTASDTWSLGVLLFTMLTGEKPFAFDLPAPQQIYESIRDTPPRLASAVVTAKNLIRELSGDLDNILLMALRFEPERRYRSVSALAGDIQKHLAGLPVSARDDTWRYRAGKFVHRHKAAVLAGSLAAVALATGTVATAWEARVAERERARAEQRFTDVGRVANSLLFDVHDALRGVAGAEAARRMVLDRALNFFDSLARDAGGDLALERELGNAYERAGDVETQGNDPAAAVASYVKAARMRENVASASPRDLDIRRDLISNYSKLSDAAWARGNATEAVRYAEKSLELSQSIGTDAASKSDRVRLATDYLDYGYKLAALAGQRRRGTENCRTAVRLFEKLAAEKPLDSRLPRIAAAACERTAELLDKDPATAAEAARLRKEAIALRAQAPD